MKKILGFLMVIMLISFTSNNTPLTKEERKNAVAYYKETQKGLAAAIKGLSENQLNWKPADSVWSVANCVEHIAISEKNINDWMLGTVAAAANPEKRAEIKASDDQVKQMVESRDKKVKTGEAFEPSGQFGSAEESFEVFKERRAGIIKYIETTQEDLRNHVADTPVGALDSYQMLLFLAAHSKRHTDQILELKANPSFPKE